MNTRLTEMRINVIRAASSTISPAYSCLKVFDRDKGVRLARLARLLVAQGGMMQTIVTRKVNGGAISTEPMGIRFRF